MFVPTYSPATHAGPAHGEDEPLVAVRGYDGPTLVRGGMVVERSLKVSRKFCISVLSINIEISRRAVRPQSRADNVEAAYRRSQMAQQLERAADAARADLMLRR